MLIHYIEIGAAIIVALCSGYLLHSVLQTQKMIQTTSFLVLRLLSDFDHEMKGKDIANTILDRTMGLIPLPRKHFFDILQQQYNSGLLKIVEMEEVTTWEDVKFEITLKGQKYLEEVVNNIPR